MGEKRAQISTSASGIRGSFHLHRGHTISQRTLCQLFCRFYWPLWVSILCLVVILTVFNVALSLNLINFVTFTSENVKSIAPVNIPSSPSVVKNENLTGLVFRLNYLNAGIGRFDNSRKYVIQDFVFQGESWVNLSAKQTVTLATQTSVEHLFRVVELSQFWQGLVSLAVFVPGEDYHVAVLYLQLLTRCFDVLKQNLSVHFVHPVNKPPKTVAGLSTWFWSDCSKWASAFKDISSHHSMEFYRWRSTLIFPQNHLRNVARKGSQTSFVYLIDIDIVPRFGLSHELNIFLRHPPCERCAFVVPTYEVNEYNLHLPINKSSLLRLVKQNQSQPFHKSVFIHNQYATNSSIWETLPEGNTITVAYPVTNFELFYEPFYVARDDVCPHDERFVGYGFTRNTQVYEMHVAGYKFVVLNYAFALHRGFRKKRKKDPWREKQNRHNSILFKSFKKEIHLRYEYVKKST